MIRENSTNQSGIYKITNKFNNRIYIGSATIITRRWRDHERNLLENKHCNKFLQNDYNKCLLEHLEEKNPFIYEVIEFANKKDLLIREQFYIDQYYDNHVNCYNICEKSGSTLGWVPSEHTRKLWREQRKGKDTSKATKASSLIITGVHRTEEVKLKISIGNKGKIRSQEIKNKMAEIIRTEEWKLNLKLAKQNISLETRNKIRQSRLGTTASCETKEKMSKQRKGVNNPNYGKKMSEEQKEKIKLTKSIQRYGDKSFTFENLNGEIKKLFGIELSKFKLEHNLEKSSFCRLLKG